MSTAGLRTAAVVAALTVLAAVVAIAASEPLSGSGDAPTAVREDSGPAPAGEPGAEELPPQEVAEAEQLDDPSSRLDVPAWLAWTAAVLLAYALIAAAVLLVRELRRWLVVRRGRAPGLADPAPEREPASEVVRRAVDAALVPLRDADDPRAAVIEAYVRMEHVLAERDLARRSPEAPREYLGRVLGEQGMPGQSLTTLTALFEEARFSHHAIPATARDRARAELERARDALQDRISTPTS